MAKYKVGDIIVPADGSSYIGQITYMSEEDDTVRHKCLTTGKEYEKSYYGFPVRYCSVKEMLEWNRKFSKENIELHQEVIKLTLRAETAEATLKRVQGELHEALNGREREYHRAEEAIERELAAKQAQENTKAADIHSCGPTCSRQACVLTRKRDEARHWLGELLAIIHRDGGHHTEAVGISQSVADAHAVWAALMAERDAAQERDRLAKMITSRIQAERDAARAEVARLNAQLESITAENHSRAMREARSLEDWASLRAEAERMRDALRKLLLSRDAAWTGGHDWKEAVDDAIKALGVEVNE